MEKYCVDPHLGIDLLYSGAFILTFAYFAGRKFRNRTAVKPSGKLDLTSFTEVVFVGVLNFTKNFLGEKANSY